MSVGVCVTSREGIAIATDTRRMVRTGAGGHYEIGTEKARKLFLLGNGTAAATVGAGTIDGKTIGALMEDFDASQQGALATAEAIGAWFSKLLGKATQPRRGPLVTRDALSWPLGFIVGGYDGDIGRLYEVSVRAGDSKVQVLQPNTQNPGVRSFGQDDGILRLLNGVDHKALRQAKVAIPPEKKPNLELLSYELFETETLEGAVAFAQSLVEVQFLAQDISRRTYASDKARVPGCGGEIRTIVVSPGGANWERAFTPRRIELLAPADAAPRREQQSA